MVHLVPHGPPSALLIVTPWLDLLGAFCILNIQGHEWGAAEQFFTSKKIREGLKQEAHPKKGQHQAGLASPSQPAMDLLRLLGSLR